MNNPTNPQDENDVVLQLVKKCTEFLLADNDQIGNKFCDLNLLYAMWNKDTDEDYSADVYEAVVEMFAANVFRPLPPSSYGTGTDNELPAAVSGDITINGTADNRLSVAAAEFTQTVIVYQSFQTFMDRVLFDPEKAAPHVGRRRFINGLVHRLNSGDQYERLTVRDTMTRVWDTCPSVRPGFVSAVVAELADFAYGYAPRHNGVDELLDFAADTVIACGDAEPTALDKLSRVLVHLLKHQLLYSFKSKLIECVRALDVDRRDIIPQMLIFIVKLLPFQNLKTVALLRTMVELYEWCDKDKWIPLQLQIVGHLCKLFSNDDFQLADESMNFWNRILHENITFWKNNQDNVRIVVNALKKVIQTHWNLDCVQMANSLLNIMVMRNVMKNIYMEDQEELFQEGKLNNINYDYMSKHIMMPLKNGLTLSPSLTGTSTIKTDPTIV